MNRITTQLITLAICWCTAAAVADSPRIYESIAFERGAEPLAKAVDLLHIPMLHNRDIFADPGEDRRSILPAAEIERRIRNKYGLAADYAGPIIIDMEPYTRHWDIGTGVGYGVAIERVRAALPGASVGVFGPPTVHVPDGDVGGGATRQMVYADAEHVLAACDFIAPQCYTGRTEFDEVAAQRESWRMQQSLQAGKPVYAVISGETDGSTGLIPLDPSVVAARGAHLLEQGATAVIYWAPHRFDDGLAASHLRALRDLIEPGAPPAEGELPEPIDGRISLIDVHGAEFDGGGLHFDADLMLRRCTDVTVRNASFKSVTARSHDRGPLERLTFENVGVVGGEWDFNTIEGDHPQVADITLDDCWSHDSPGQGLWARRVARLRIVNGFTIARAGEDIIRDHSVYLNACEDIDFDRIVSVDPASMHLKLQQLYGENNHIGELLCFGGDGIGGFAVNSGSDDRPAGFDGGTGIYNLRIDTIHSWGLGSEGRLHRSERGIKWGIVFRAADCSIGLLHIAPGHPQARAAMAGVEIGTPDNEHDAISSVTIERYQLDDPDIAPLRTDDGAGTLTIREWLGRTPPGVTPH